jgi:uncharacterized protein YegJ (DUF2314 family)
MWRRILGRAKGGETHNLSLSIPVDLSPFVGFGVYFDMHQSGDALHRDFAAKTKSWLASHADGHASEAIGMFIDNGALEFMVADRADVPEPPAALLSRTSRSGLEQRRFGTATHVVVVRTRDSVRHRHLGMWSALAGARAAALDLNGVVMDPVIPRLLPVESASGTIPSNLEIHIAEHIIVPMSVGDTGLAWMTTSGLAKFGLPDLELWDLPPNFDKMATVVNGIAQHLLRTVAASASAVQGNLLHLESEVGIDRRDLAEASGANLTGAQVPAPAVVRLQFAASQRAEAGVPMIQILPPHSFRGEKTVWYASLLDGLIGSQDEIKGVATENKERALAHQRAVAELPGVKQKFVGGLRPGETLFVKKGFSTDSGVDEFMWIVITRWTGSDLTGQLANTSHYRRDLAMGQSITLSESEIFDWMILLPGGHREGGYTSEIAVSEGKDLGAQS